MQRLACLSILAVLLRAPAADAQVRTLDTNYQGAWRIKREIQDPNGIRICTLQNVGQSSSFGLHVYQTDTAAISVSSDDWSLQPGSGGVANISLDKRSFSARFERYSNNGLVARNMNMDFIGAFMESQRLSVLFPNGDNLSFGLPSQNAISVFVSCLENHLQRRDPFR